MGLFPKWIGELSWGDFFGGVKEDVKKIPSVIGDVVSGITKPILGGVTGGLTPTIIWLVIIIVVGLLLYTWFRKIVKV